MRNAEKEIKRFSFDCKTVAGLLIILALSRSVDVKCVSPTCQSYEPIIAT